MKQNVGKAVKIAVLTVGAFVMIFPFLWMLFTSLKTLPESISIPPTLFPAVPQFENYTEALAVAPFGLYLRNSIIVAGGGVYKLVAVKQPDGSYTPKMKCSDSASKAIIPGKKMPWRLYDENGQAQCDLIAMDDEVIEAGKPVTMVNLDSDAIERTVTITPTKVKKLLVPHVLNGQLAIELPSIAEKKAYIAKQLTEETWESELRLECPHKHYVNMTPAVAECRSKMYAELHGGKV